MNTEAIRINKFMSSICFEDIGIYDSYEFGLKLRNSTVFKFMECYYQYSFNREETYLTLCYYSDDNDIDKANVKLKNSTHILSYIFSIPIIGEFDDFRSSILVDKIDMIETKPYTKKIIQLHDLEYIISKINSKKKYLFYQSIEHFYNGLRFLCMDGLDEEAFVNFFKVVEIIAKHYFELKKVEIMKFHPSEASDFLKRFIYDKTKISYSTEKLESIAGDFKHFIYNHIDDTYSKIAFFANYNNIKFHVNKLNKIISVRNKIVHGNTISNIDIKKYTATLLLLCKEFISIYFFKMNYNKLELDAKANVN